MIFVLSRSKSPSLIRAFHQFVEHISSLFFPRLFRLFIWFNRSVVRTHSCIFLCLQSLTRLITNCHLSRVLKLLSAQTHRQRQNIASYYYKLTPLLLLPTSDVCQKDSRES